MQEFIRFNCLPIIPGVLLTIADNVCIQNLQQDSGPEHFLSKKSHAKADMK